MTTVRDDLAIAPERVWPAAVSTEVAVRTVARRLQPGIDLTARLYHHPFLGMMFLCGDTAGCLRWRVVTGPVVAAVVVDMVGGCAFLSDPWNDEDFTTRALALAAAAPSSPGGGSAPVRGPAPRLTQEEAVEAGRALLPGLLARRRRLDRVGPVRLTGPPVYFGKPNWWVAGRHGKRDVEVVVDALSGRHYVASA